MTPTADVDAAPEWRPSGLEVDAVCVEDMPDGTPCGMPRDHASHIDSPQSLMSRRLPAEWMHDFLDTDDATHPWPRPDAFLRHEPDRSHPWWVQHTVSGEVLAFTTRAAAVAAIGISPGTAVFDLELVEAAVAGLSAPDRQATTDRHR